MDGLQRHVRMPEEGSTKSTRRQMVRAELLGKHTHETRTGIRVHVWVRDGRFLARGSFQRKRFGETLGDNERNACARLREILYEIETGRYSAPSDSRKHVIAKVMSSRLTLRDLLNDFLREKRKLRGQRTCVTYRSRLAHILDYAEQPNQLTRYPFAENIDRNFIVELRVFLHSCLVSPNGRIGAKQRQMTARGVINSLVCFRTALAWASNAAVRKLSASWVNPLTNELIGKVDSKDPFRPSPLSIDARVRMVGMMDAWQIRHLALSLVLPLRPNEATGLLVSDVDFEHGWLNVGTRFGGADFTKGRQTFRLPYPRAIEPLIRHCVGGRVEGPLLRSRHALAGEYVALEVNSIEDLRKAFESELLQAASTVQCEQDRKQVFRRLLRKLGGVTEDGLAAEFSRAAESACVKNVTLMDLRRANTQGLKDAGVPHLELRYLTSHTTSDILNEYTSIDPVAAMEKYSAFLRSLLQAMTTRSSELGMA